MDCGESCAFKKQSVLIVTFGDSITCSHAGKETTIINVVKPWPDNKMKALLCIKTEINFIREQRARDLILREFSTPWTEIVKKLPE